MVIGRNITQKVPKHKAWKKRHADMLVMLARGYDSNGRLSHELKSLIKTKFKVHDTTIRRVWNKYKTEIMSSEAPIIKRKAGAGKKPKISQAEFEQKNRDVPMHKRKTLSSLACASGIPKSTIIRYFKKGMQ
jgi:hypothetical protein